MIASASTPGGSVPKARPPPPRRPAQNASATAGGAWRRSRLACSATARSSTTARARHCGSSSPSAATRGADAIQVGVEARVGAGGELALGQEGGQALGLPRHRAQDVERDDVARALPDRADLDVAVELGHRRLLDVAVAAQALQRLGGEGRAALAHPVLRDREGEAPERGLGRVVTGVEGARRGAASPPVAASDSIARSASTLRIAGWSASGAPKAWRWRQCQTASATTRRIIPAHADERVEPGPDDLLDHERGAAPLLAEDARGQAVELDLAGGQAAAAELVLQALEAEAGVGALGDEAGDAARAPARG